jgi:hypothetical protein
VGAGDTVRAVPGYRLRPLRLESTERREVESWLAVSRIRIAPASCDVPSWEDILGFIHDVSRAASETQDAYLSLCWLLLAVLADDHDPGEVGRMAGRLTGKAALSNGPGTPDDALVQLEGFLESRGFMPKQIGSTPEVGFELGCCPYEEAALANPGLVCGLHKALAEGMLEALGGALEVTNLVARHPTTAGCRLELRAVGQPA